MATEKNKLEALVDQEAAVDQEATMLASMSDKEKLGYFWARLEELEKEIAKRKAEGGKSPEELERDQKKAALRAKIRDQEAYLNEEVKIMLPKIPVDGYKEPVFVSINGKSCRIERGVPIMIKRKYANLLDQSQIQDAATVNLMENEANRYATDELTTK